MKEQINPKVKSDEPNPSQQNTNAIDELRKVQSEFFREQIKVLNKMDLRADEIKGLVLNKLKVVERVVDSNFKKTLEAYIRISKFLPTPKENNEEPKFHWSLPALDSRAKLDFKNPYEY